jgi:succinate-semialdehyde dehydrogenase/glutarate-semialdehyde dehydrogenase
MNHPDSAIRRAALLINGAWCSSADTFPVVDKFSGELIGLADRASRAQVDEAIAAARKSFESVSLDAYERYRILNKASALIESQRALFVRTIVAETGFPHVDAENEVSRAVQVFMLCAEEAKRLAGEVVPIEAAPGQSHRLAFTIRVPRGVVCGITSFNSPLNMVAHKVAPALASGNAVVVKPAQATPLSAALLFELLLEARVPPGHLNLVQGPGSEVGAWLAENPAIAFYTFTGSTAVGRRLRQSVGLRPIALELGSIAATIVCDDADLDRAAARCTASAFRRAGQSCNSVQRLLVDEKVFDDFLERFASTTRKLKVGDPHDPQNTIGPMISEAEAQRAERWIVEAIEQKARVVVGGKRVGPLLEPTILIDTQPSMRVVCEEIFGPVVSVIRFKDLAQAIALVNSVPYGLGAGIFTKDVTRAFRAAREIHAGLVHINDPSSSRVDLVPFSGVKDSGLGREGPKYAMQEMTEERLITLSLD